MYTHLSAVIYFLGKALVIFYGSYSTLNETNCIYNTRAGIRSKSQVLIFTLLLKKP